MCKNDSQMLWAIGRISAGSSAGTPSIQLTSSPSVFSVAAARLMPATSGLRASSDRRVPRHSGQGPSFKKRATRASPFSSFTFESAFSTVRTAL